jgi:hypothetical protein
MLVRDIDEMAPLSVDKLPLHVSSSAKGRDVHLVKADSINDNVVSLLQTISDESFAFLSPP